MSNVNVVKLVTGEELVADVTDLPKKDSLSLKEPLMLLPQQKQDGSFGVAIMGYAQSVEGDTIEVGYDKVVYIAPAKAELIEHYNKIHGNIVVPTKAIQVV
jgi:hypothetical protein